MEEQVNFEPRSIKHSRKTGKPKNTRTRTINKRKKSFNLVDFFLENVANKETLNSIFCAAEEKITRIKKTKTKKGDGENRSKKYRKRKIDMITIILLVFFTMVCVLPLILRKLMELI